MPVTISPYALTTLAGAKAQLRITDTSQDDFITTLINQASARIETICGRKFAARDYRMRYNGLRQYKLVLRNGPIQSVTSVLFGINTALNILFTNPTAVAAQVGCSNDPESPVAGAVRLFSQDSGGNITNTALGLTNYPTTSLMAAAISAIPGWSANAGVTAVPSAYLDPLAGQTALNTQMMLTYPDQNMVTYTVDYTRGTVAFDQRVWEAWACDRAMYYEWDFPRGHMALLVQYRGGFEVIPDDVNYVCNWLVQVMYYEGLNDPFSQRETIGPYSNTSNNQLDPQNERYIRDRLGSYIDHACIAFGGMA